MVLLKLASGRVRPRCNVRGTTALGLQPTHALQHLSLKRRLVPCKTAQRDSPAAAVSAGERQVLQQELQLAVKAENFAEAAILKRKLDALDAEDPILQLRAALQAAVAEERYQDAARLKRDLRMSESQVAGELMSAEVMASTSSDTITQGIRVSVKSFYVPAQSAPKLQQWFFAYRVTIANEGKRVVQLRNRHWIILDANGKKEEVRGPGVVGEQPILLPGKRFEYTSGCPLRTPCGSMEGSYSMAILRESDGEFADTMDVKIGRFELSTQGEVAA